MKFTAATKRGGAYPAGDQEISGGARGSAGDRTTCDCGNGSLGDCPIQLAGNGAGLAQPPALTTGIWPAPAQAVGVWQQHESPGPLGQEVDKTAESGWRAA